MPRTKIGKNDKYRKLEILINGAIQTERKSRDDIGLLLDMGETATRKYLRDPIKLPTDKLFKLGRYLNIPIDELRQSIPY